MNKFKYIETKNANNTLKFKIYLKDKILSQKFLRWVFIILSAIIISVFFRMFVFSLSETNSYSMYPSIMPGEYILELKFLSLFNNIKRSDIVLFKAWQDENTNGYDRRWFQKEPILVKRVIATGGETVEIKDSKVYINGKYLIEDYVINPKSSDFGPFTVPENCYFVMGDNRANSQDSRDWENNYITHKMITGKAVFKFGVLK